MTKNLLACLIAAPLLFTAAAASASTISFTSLNPASPGFTYTPLADAILFHDGNLTPQDPTSVQGYTEDVFNLTPGSLTLVGFGDQTSDTAGSFSNDVAFNYLAVHFGGSELFFNWNTGINSFTIADFKSITAGEDGKGGGLSNFRAYSGVSAVPLPAAAWLFGSALMGFMGFRRKAV